MTYYVFSGTLNPTHFTSLSDSCLSVLSVTLVYCGQMVGRIQMKLSTQVGLGPGHNVLDGYPAPPSQKREQSPPIFGPCLLCPNGWMDQDSTWHGGRPQYMQHCVRSEPSSPSPRMGQSPPIFSPCLLWPNGMAKRLHGSRWNFAWR